MTLNEASNALEMVPMVGLSKHEEMEAHWCPNKRKWLLVSMQSFLFGINNSFLLLDWKGFLYGLVWINIDWIGFL